MSRQTAPFLVVITLALTQWAIPAWTAPQAPSTTRKPTTSTAHRTTTAPRSSASLLNPASLKLQAPPVFDVRFVTTKGDFVLEVTRAWSPHGADRFYNLVKYNFYDGAAFFRIIQGLDRKSVV